MDVLAIDAGNTRIKWGFADAQGWVRQDAVDSAQPGQLADAFSGLPAPDAIVVALVAGEAVRSSIVRAAGCWPAAPLWVRGCAQQCGVKSGYADPAQLGADRWAGVIAAWHRVRAACVVVNAGTTMTVDALSADAVFLGGIIVPGFDLMRRSLASGTARLPLAEGAFCYFPDNTADAIASGATNALIGAVERMRDFMVRSGQPDPLVLMSGGSAPRISPQLNGRCELVDNLVLEGLLLIAREDSRK